MINLLPPDEKNAYIQEKNWKIVLIWGINFLFFLTFLTLVLLAIKFYTAGQVEKQKMFIAKTEEGLDTAERKNLQKRAREFNETFNTLNSFYQKQPVFNDLIERLTANLPLDVYLTGISVTTNSSWRAVLTISGFSPTRDSLLSFKKNLESQADFYEVTFPPSSWVQPTDIIFNVSFKVK